MNLNPGGITALKNSLDSRSATDNLRPMVTRRQLRPGMPSTRRLRVLHVINDLGPGGAETVLYRLTTQALAVDHEVICLHAPDWYSVRLKDAGIPVHHLNWATPASVAPWPLYRLIKGSGADIVQGWMYRSNLIAGLIAKVAGIPVVWNIRCSSLDTLRFGSRVLVYAGGVLASWIPKFVINCSAQSEELHRQWGYGTVEGRVIANGYDPAFLYPDEQARVATRAQLGMSGDSFVIGTVGRWHAMKGYSILLKAARLLADRGVPFRLLFIGRALQSGNAELVALIRDSGCEDFVQLFGERSDIPDLDRALDLHVLASVGAEGFPNVVAETMLSGTPNVVTDIGDAGLIVGDTGWVVQRGDAVRLADAIEAAFREWKSSGTKWRHRREMARKRIIENFSLDGMVRAYEAVWQKVAQANGL